MDKSDDYQIVNFFLSFKTSMFFSAGIVNMVVGYLLYFQCATVFVPGKYVSPVEKCNAVGPGA
jgi:hypothetical protein